MDSSRNSVNLDFIRSVAVLLVATSHLLLYTGHLAWAGWSGITGVCIFFVHTSLVLMWSLERDSHVGRFYIRRVFRIYPLWIALLLLTLWSRLPMSPELAPAFRYVDVGHWEVLANLLLVQNLWFGSRVAGVSWTLPIEVQMYLFLPFLFFFVRSTRALWALLLIDGFVMVYAIRSLPPVSSTLLTCAPYFIAGVIAYQLSKKKGLQVLPGWSFPIFFFGMITLDHFFGSFRHAWFFCLALGLALPLFRDMTSSSVKIASHYVARYSYGVYLFHPVAICISIYLLREHSPALRVASFLGAVTVLPVAFYHGLEAPMIRYGARLAKRLQPGVAPRLTERAMELEPAP